MITILLLAAGSSSRMRGGDKLLEEVDGAPLLRTLALRALAANQDVLVALPCDKPAREDALAGLDVSTISVPDADHGMAHSLRAAIGALPTSTSAVMVLPADMPEITIRDFQTLISAHAVNPSAILRGATKTLEPGHPVVFPKRFFEELRALEGDIGARAVLRKHKADVKLVPLPEQHALTDLDTPEQWADWRAARMAT